jgi:hypothetical protein
MQLRPASELSKIPTLMRYTPTLHAVVESIPRLKRRVTSAHDALSEILNAMVHMAMVLAMAIRHIQFWV